MEMHVKLDEVKFKLYEGVCQSFHGIQTWSMVQYISHTTRTYIIAKQIRKILISGKTIRKYNRLQFLSVRIF